MKKIMAFAAVALMGAAALAGCSSGGGSAAAGEPVTLENITGSWVLESGKGAEGEIKPIEGTPVQLTVEADGAFGVNGGCNNLVGTVAVDGDKLSMGPVASTMMACEEAPMALDVVLTQALEAVDAGKIDGDKLVLTGKDTELTFNKG